MERETEPQTESPATERETEPQTESTQTEQVTEPQTENTQTEQVTESQTEKTEITESESAQVLDYNENEFAYPDYCSQSNQAAGGTETDYCKAHLTILYETDSLLLTGKAEDAEKACEIWKEEVIRLYDEWAAGANQALQGMVIAVKAGFLAQYDMEKTALTQQAETAGWAEVKVYQMLEKKLSNHAAWLCALKGE